jgi:hypothetical protein
MRLIKYPSNIRMPKGNSLFLSKIDSSIDKLLDKQVSWTCKESEFYDMLIKKIEKYKEKNQWYKQSSIDKPIILSNIKQQKWLEKSRHNSSIQRMIEHMDIIECSFINKSTETKLRLNILFADRGFSFHIKYQRNMKGLKYYIYFESIKTKNRGYVTYLNSDKEMHKKLPEYPEILGVVGHKLDRFDIVHLSSEIMHYYDAGKEITKAYMGDDYEISLSYLADHVSFDITL